MPGSPQWKRERGAYPRPGAESKRGVDRASTRHIPAWGSVRGVNRPALEEAVMPFVHPSLSTTGAGRVRRLARALLVVFTAATVLAVPAGPVSAEPARGTEPVADAVTAWNANAGEAARAACLSPIQNPLHESRLYAMTHVAVHDALNAIDSRFEPYAFDGNAKRRTSPDAAVAAAARHVLVPGLQQLPVAQTCIDAGVASVEADYAAALGALPNGTAKVREFSWVRPPPRRFSL